MPGVIEAIYLATSHGEPQQVVDSGRLICSLGLERDRYANTAPGVISLIEAEAVEQFNLTTGLDIVPGDTGRNVITRGIRLNPLVGKQFRVGDVLLEGMELCEPCATSGERLSSETVSAATIVKTLVASTGLRAIVRSTGIIYPGSAIVHQPGEYP